MKAKTIVLSLFALFITIAKTNAHQAGLADTSKINRDSTPAKYVGLKRRDPFLACLLSYVCPGGGQFYNRQNTKGVIIITAEGTCIVGLILDALGNKPGTSFDANSDPFLILASVVVAYSLIDAPVSALHINEQYHLKGKHGLSYIKLLPALIGEGNNYAFAKPTFGLKLTLR